MATDPTQTTTKCPECGHAEYHRGIWREGNYEHICAACGQAWFPDVDYSKPVSQTTIGTALWRAEFAGRLARSLLMFPLNPQPGDTWEQHERCLEVAFTTEITKALNEAEANGR